MQTLHDSLPAEAQAKLLPNKKVTGFTTDDDGVTVTCADGSTYSGTIIVGADGAHSTVRRLMREKALLQPRTAAELKVEQIINEEKPFLTTYRAMWIRFPTVRPLIQPGDASETHGKDCTLQLFAGEDTSVIGIYERMDKPTREGVRYTQQDEEKFIERWGRLPIVKGYTIQDAYTNRTQAGMVNLEEGILKRWSWERIVLAGDAAHKFTPSTGAGCNNGIVDVVALANELYHAFRVVREEGGPEAFPDKDQILAAFNDYQQARFEHVKDGLEGASEATGAATWSDITHRFVDRHVLSRPSLVKFFATRSAAATAKTPVFEYVEGEEQMIGKFPWAHPIKEVGSKAAGSKAG